MNIYFNTTIFSVFIYNVIVYKLSVISTREAVIQSEACHQVCHLYTHTHTDTDHSEKWTAVISDHFPHINFQLSESREQLGQLLTVLKSQRRNVQEDLERLVSQQLLNQHHSLFSCKTKLALCASGSRSC